MSDETKIPAEFADYPLTIQAIIETEGIFDDKQSGLKAGSSWIPTASKPVNYVDVCVSGKMKRHRITPPYTTYEERLAECIKLHKDAKGGFFDRQNAISLKMQDNYLAQVMRGNISIGS